MTSGQRRRRAAASTQQRHVHTAAPPHLLHRGCKLRGVDGVRGAVQLHECPRHARQPLVLLRHGCRRQRVAAAASGWRRRRGGGQRLLGSACRSQPSVSACFADRAGTGEGASRRAGTRRTRAPAAAAGLTCGAAAGVIPLSDFETTSRPGVYRGRAWESWADWGRQAAI